MLQGKGEQSPSMPSHAEVKLMQSKAIDLPQLYQPQDLTREKHYYLIITKEPSGLCFTFKRTYIDAHFFLFPPKSLLKYVLPETENSLECLPADEDKLQDSTLNRQQKKAVYSPGKQVACHHLLSKLDKRREALVDRQTS